jgi:hypothetical protein
MMNDNTLMEKEIISMGLRDFWGYLKRKLASKRGCASREIAFLFRRIRLEIQSSDRSRKKKDAENHSTVRES